MVSIKMSRVGKKGRPYFHLIITDKQKDPWGTYIEKVGFYDPRTKEKKFEIDRIKHWLSLGAQPTDTVRNLLIDSKVLEGKKATVSSITAKRNAKLAAAKKAAEETAASKTPAA